MDDIINYKVYMHIAPNGKKYIGITKQKIERRWRRGSACSYRENIHFSNAISKYGWENIQHIVLFEGLDAGKASRIEQVLVAAFKSNQREFGYNKTDGGEGTSGYIPLEAARLKMSASHLGEKNYFYGRHHTGETKAKISSATSARHRDGAYYNAQMLMSERMSGKGNPMYGITISAESLRIMGLKHAKPVICITTGEEFESVRVAAARYGYDPGTIASCCRGKREYGGRHPKTREKLRWKFHNK